MNDHPNDSIYMENIAKSWSDISISKYREILKAAELEGSDKVIAIISIITGMSKKAVMSLDKVRLNEIISTLQFTNVPPKTRLVERFDLAGMRFAIVPDLNGLTAGEILDLEEYVQDANANLHKIMGVIYRPIIKEDALGYEVEPYDGLRAQKAAEIFEDELSIEIAHSALLFFSVIGSVSLMSTMSYSDHPMMEKK